MASKLPQIKAVRAGRNLNIIIEDKKFTVVGDASVHLPIQEKIKLYNEKKSPKLLKEIEAYAKPKTTKEKIEKEKKELETIAEKKAIKREIKEIEQNYSREEKLIRTKEQQRTSILEKLVEDKILEPVEKGYALAGYPSVTMPDLLVDRFIDFIALKQDLEPIINFWMWCLLNPNKVARYKLFAYLSRHRLIITPSGYFVTYRMVKSTPTSEETGIYVDAHTGKFNHIIGEVSRIPRSECDEDGSRDCSRGLHVGSPEFIGISLGDGYNKGEIKTRVQGGGYGTGYGSPGEVTTQKFDNTFGNQAVICIVNPMHVVSVPDSDTRKLRACEIFIAKKTTADEVLNHLTTYDYLVFDSEYAAIESREIRERLKEANLSEFSDGTVEKMTSITDVLPSNFIKKRALENRLAQLGKEKLLNDIVADDISVEEMMKVISSRIKVTPAPKVHVNIPEEAELITGTKGDHENLEQLKQVFENPADEIQKDIDAVKTEEPKKESFISKLVGAVKGKKKEESKVEQLLEEEVKLAEDLAKEPQIKESKAQSLQHTGDSTEFIDKAFAKIKASKKNPTKFFIGKDANGLILLTEVAVSKFQGEVLGTVKDLKLGK